jgi:four helix bundle protein
MSLHVGQVSFEMIAAIRPLVHRVRRHDRSLADQLVRAASSVALNIAEAEQSDPGNGKARLFTAAGSANETLAALRLAVAWGYVTAGDTDSAAVLAGRVVAMLWRLTHA